VLAWAALWARADIVEMVNGDRYVGKVQSMNADTLVLQNEVLGTVQLPRGKVAQITLGAVRRGGGGAGPASPAVPRASVAPAAGGSASTNAIAGMSELAGHSNLIQQVQRQFMAGAGPEANQKFDELLNGLMSGKLSMDDLRAQAQSAADQLRELKRQGGQEAGLATDTYLTILDQFLKETAPSGSGTSTNVPPEQP